jgi:hypothetical protein
MKNNNQGALHPPPDYHPTTNMWARLVSNVVLVQKLSKFLKLVEIAIVMVVSNVEDEKKFSTISFMKSKLHNRLPTNLNLVV